MPFSYDRAWQDVMAMARANLAMLVAVAGAFVFFPTAVMFVAAPPPESVGDGATALETILGYYRANAGYFLLVALVTSFGQLAMLVLLLDRSRPTVAEALGQSGRLFLSFVIVQIATNIAVAAGAMLFIVPGLYLLGRFAVANAVVAGQKLSNPVDAVTQGWAMTKGRGWSILGFLLLIGIVGWIALSAASAVFTIIFALLLPDSLKPLVGAIADGASGAVLTALMTLLVAAVYRQLTAERDVAEVFS